MGAFVSARWLGLMITAVSTSIGVVGMAAAADPPTENAMPESRVDKNAASSAAMDGCRDRIARIEQEVRERRNRYSVMPPQDVRALREAALALARAGDADGCDVVADRLQVVMDERKDDWTAEQARQRIEEAKPVWSVVTDLRASRMIGAEVMSAPQEEVGEIADVILTSDTHEYLLLERGGFLGLGEDLVPVPAARVRMTEDGHTFVLDVGSNIDQAPTLEEVRKLEKDRWPQKVDAWWSDNASATASGEPAR